MTTEQMIADDEHVPRPKAMPTPADITAFPSDEADVVAMMQRHAEACLTFARNKRLSKRRIIRYSR